MNIHTRIAQRSIQMFKDNQLPSAEPETKEADLNLVKHYEALREEFIELDNSDFDSDKREGELNLTDGKYSGYKCSIDGDRMTQSIERQGYATIDEFVFSDQGIEITSATHNSSTASPGPVEGNVSFTRIAKDGASFEEKKWWINVDKQFEEYVTPNVRIGV